MMELPIILGTQTTTAAIVLYAFLQQNLLFDAFANKLDNVDSSIAFLFDLTNIFAMIGLLVLLFSPSLWKTKYIASWVFLFVIVVLGGSTGREFGYNFTDVKNGRYANYLSQKVEINGYDCSVEAALGGGTSCEDDKPDGSNLGNSGKPSILDIGSNSAANAHNNSDSQLSDMYGFLPQVVILYVTNKLKYSVKKALFDLSEKQFAKRMDQLNKMRAATLPNPQLAVWVSAFDELCGAKIYEKAEMNTADFLAMPASYAGRINVTTEGFAVKDLMRVIKQSEALQENDKTLIAPLIDFAIGTEGNPDDPDPIQTRVGNIAKGLSNGKEIDVKSNGERYLNHYTIHKATGILTPTYSLHIDMDGSDLKERVEKTADLRKSRNHEDLGDKFVNDYGDEIAGLAIPKNLKPISFLTKRSDDIGENSAVLIENTANVVVVKSCSDFYNELKIYYRKALQADDEDLPEQIKRYKEAQYAKCHRAVGKAVVGPCLESQKRAIDAAGLSPKLAAKKEYKQAVSSIEKDANKDKGSEAKMLAERKAQNLESVNMRNAINNSFITRDTVLMNQIDKKQGIETGIPGAAFFVGGKVTKMFTNIAARMKGVFLGVEAGAYAIILPIIKDILTAFVIVLTPILFLIGLMVPKWAPGVILTSLIALAYLQMIDVVMLIVTTALSAVEKAITSGDLAELEDHKSFLMCIWAMAYMASFAITAFLMFKAGDTSFIMGKLTSADTPIRNTGNQVLDVGKKVGQATLAVVTGGATGTPLSIGAGGKMAVQGMNMAGDVAATAQTIGTGGPNPFQRAGHAIQGKKDKIVAQNAAVMAAVNTKDTRPSTEDQMKHAEEKESDKLIKRNAKVMATVNTEDTRPSNETKMKHAETVATYKKSDEHEKIDHETEMVEGLDGSKVMRMDRDRDKERLTKLLKSDRDKNLTREQRQAEITRSLEADSAKGIDGIFKTMGIGGANRSRKSKLPNGEFKDVPSVGTMLAGDSSKVSKSITDVRKVQSAIELAYSKMGSATYTDKDGDEHNSADNTVLKKGQSLVFDDKTKTAGATSEVFYVMKDAFNKGLLSEEYAKEAGYSKAERVEINRVLKKESTLKKATLKTEGAADQEVYGFTRIHEDDRVKPKNGPGNRHKENFEGGGGI
ncbi:MAG: conjugal transfer protein TraG [Proteobacteria bacterium]|nr:conjugal transfer protein TraG [Pseudomonadota bacterium]